MSPAQLEQTTFVIGLRNNGAEMQGTEFRASGMVIKFQGFMALYTESKDDMRTKMADCSLPFPKMMHSNRRKSNLFSTSRSRPLATPRRHS